jgi:peptidoglycan-associated lipoprotein
MFTAAILLSFAGVGCTHKQQVKTTPAPTPVEPAPTKAAATPTPAASQSAVSPQLGASANLIQQCRLDVSSQQQAPKFDYNDFELLPADRDVLQQVAECLTNGPLQGKALKLVGRADPRGTEEYNLGLGTRRAHTVAQYLEQLGVHRTQLAETTRGALDARGTDEDSWRVDRRVDLDLAE